jgi:hypothetical protein
VAGPTIRACKQPRSSGYRTGFLAPSGRPTVTAWTTVL